MPSPPLPDRQALPGTKRVHQVASERVDVCMDGVDQSANALGAEDPFEIIPDEGSPFMLLGLFVSRHYRSK